MPDTTFGKDIDAMPSLQRVLTSGSFSIGG